MTEQERNRLAFGRELAKLAAAFKTQLTNPLLDAYQESLADLSLDDVRRACSIALRTKDFMPTIHELRVLAGPTKPRTDPLWQRGLAAWAPSEPWPAEKQYGTAAFPNPRPAQEETDMDRAIRARMRAMSEGK